MLKKTVIEFLGGDVGRLAEILNVTAQAIYQWGDLVPERRAIRLKARYPELDLDFSLYDEIHPGPKQKSASV